MTITAFASPGYLTAEQRELVVAASDAAAAATAAVYDRTASSYAGTWANYATPQLDAFCARLAPGSRVADLGCGPGRDLAVLTARGLRPVGLDVSAGMLAQAGAAGGFDLVQADVAALPFRSGSLDGIWASASLLHVPHARIAGVLGELARVCRAGAALYATVKLGAGEGVGSDGRFFAYHDPIGFAGLLEQVGFVVDDVDVEPDSRRPETAWISLVATRG